MAPLLLLYGAEGYTGKLIRARYRGKLTAASRRGGDGVEKLALEDGDALRRALGSHRVVLNCAGPFAHTWRPWVEACLESGAHYLDLSGEWAVLEGMQALDARARERGVMLLPGVGFDVVASDGLASHVAERLPDARRLQIGISALTLVSRGSARTIFESAGERVRVRRNGRIVEERALLTETFDFGGGPRACHAVSWADISTAEWTTGIPNVEVYFEATPVVLGMDFLNRTFGWAAKAPLWRTAREVALGLLPAGPPSDVRNRLRTVVVARATNAAGACAEARLETPEAYTFSVDVAAEIARRVVGGEVRPGFQTPASVFGADFVLGFPGVLRTDRSPPHPSPGL